jgi:hypothetical protein
MATTAASNGTPAPTKPASRLAKVQKARIRSPNRINIYGPEGVGKTTLACSAPNAILLDIEDGSSELEVARYPFRDGPTGHVPRTFGEVVAAVDDLTSSTHEYKTLVIDSADKLEALIWKFMLERDSVVSARNPKATPLESIEDYGYGKGYNTAVEEWRAFAARLDRLRYAKGMDIVIVGHAQVRTFKNPEGEDYDRYQLRINEKAASFLKEWSDVTAFMCFEDDAKKSSKYGRPKGFSTGRRILRTSRSAAVDAKSRISLPDEVAVDIDNPWAPFAAAIADSIDAEVPKLVDAIATELARIGDVDLAAKAKGPIAAAAEAKDSSALTRYLNDLRKRPAKEADPQ